MIHWFRKNYKGVLCMICKKCGYVLFGSETFCPNCGAKCEIEEEKKETEISTGKSAEKESPSRHSGRKVSDIDVFSSEPVYVYSEKREKRKKSSGLAVTFIVTFAITLVGVGGLIAADYFGLIPSVSTLMPSEKETTILEPLETSTLHSDYSDTDGIVPPQISFKPVLCFIGSEGNLSLRKGPGDVYAQFSALPSGTQVQVIGGSVTERNWVYAYVPEDDSYGWLCSSFLSTENAFAEDIANE